MMLTGGMNEVQTKFESIRDCRWHFVSVSFYKKPPVDLCTKQKRERLPFISMEKTATIQAYLRMFVRVLSSPSGSKVYSTSNSSKRRSMDVSNKQRLSLIQIETNENTKKMDEVHLTIPEGTLTKSESNSSLVKAKRRIKKIRRNTCVGAISLLILGVLFNGLAYFASVWSAQLNAEVIEAAVAKHQSLNFRLKKAVIEGPSKYLIGLLSFIGRVFSAIGTLMLAQALITWCQKRRSGYLRGAAGHADGAVDEIHGGCAEVIGDCFTHCLSFA